MDFVNGFLNFFAPIFTISTFLFFRPAYLSFKSLSYIWRSIFSENVAGKVVVIAGASSGMGEHMRMQRGVAEIAYMLGSPRAIPLRTDVAQLEDCRRLIEEAISQFGRLDHLVVSAGVTAVSMFEDTFEVANFSPAMDINFWGLVYANLFCCSPLEDYKREDCGDCIFCELVECTKAKLLQCQASKAAVVSFVETLWTEYASNIGITLVTPGLIESEITKGKFLNKDGKMVVDQDMRDVVMTVVAIETVGRCAKAIINSACRGDKYLTWPPWVSTAFFVKMLCPEAVDWFNRWFLVTNPGTPLTEAIRRKLIDLPRL